MHLADWAGETTSELNFSAEAREEDEAAATTVCLISWTWRVEGSIRRSLVKVRAIPPVAIRMIVSGLIIGISRYLTYPRCPNGRLSART